MEKSAELYPVLPGKDPRVIARILEGRRDEYVESRRRHGVKVERAYEQVTPMGTFLIAYHESDRSFGEIAAAMAQSDLAIDRDFLAGIREVHGVDVNQPPPGEPPEVLADWVDETARERKRGLAFCAPVRPGATGAGRALAREAYVTRKEQLAASRRALGVTRELVCLNHTPAGDIVCVYFEADDPVESNRRLAASRSDYDVWFKDRLREIFPPEVDFDQPIPPVSEVFDSQPALVAR